MMKSKIILSAALTISALTGNSKEMTNINSDTSFAPVEKPELTQEWDKVFPKSDKVEHSKVVFANRYGVTLAADMYKPEKATVASTMYDMTRVNANGYFDSENTAAQRNSKRAAMAAQRTLDFVKGAYLRGGGVVDPLPEDAPQFVKDYHAYYKTPRGYHVRSGNSNDGWNVTSNLPFLNFKFFEYADELENVVLIVHGDKAHSYYFGKDTFAKLKGDNKQMLTVKGASHCDLYDQLDIIPMDEIAAFYTEYLKR